MRGPPPSLPRPKPRSRPASSARSAQRQAFSAFQAFQSRGRMLRPSEPKQAAQRSVAFEAEHLTGSELQELPDPGPSQRVGLGLRLELLRDQGRSSVIVREVTPGSAAHRSGQIALGDVIE